MRPTVSIVTITFNAEEVINKTINSVLMQDYLDFEFLFIDGKSPDKTIDIIESFRPMFEDKGVKFRVLSEFCSIYISICNKCPCYKRSNVKIRI